MTDDRDAPQLSLAQARLREERKAWRREKPFGFWARPMENEKDGSLDVLRRRLDG